MIPGHLLAVVIHQRPAIRVTIRLAYIRYIFDVKLLIRTNSQLIIILIDIQYMASMADIHFTFSDTFYSWCSKFLGCRG
jgi:hypothetical protein